jgi:hypothetical protein
MSYTPTSGLSFSPDLPLFAAIPIGLLRRRVAGRHEARA